MKYLKIEMTSEIDVQSLKEGINLPELEVKFEVELKNREKKRKIIKDDTRGIEGNIIKNSFLDFKNISGKDSNYKGKKGNMKKYQKNNYKINIINNKKNIFMITIIMIFFNLLSQSYNKIEYKFSNVSLKIRGPGNEYILSPHFNSNNYPNIIYINENQNFTITNRYYFNEINNTVNLIWNNSIDSSYRMFQGCSNIIEIDLSNFDTSKLTNMSSMFNGCSQLYSLNLSNFDTSNAKYMYNMFDGCSKLISLDLSYFNTERVSNMDSMFKGCSKLEYINLKNFKETNLRYYPDIFKNVPDNIVVCLNDNSNIIKQQIMDKTCYTIDCSDNWKINKKKKVNKKDVCYNNFNKGIIYKWEYQGLYYENCINGNLMIDSKINYCNCDNKKCLYCSNISLIYDLCIDCNIGYYEKEDDENTFGYKKCHKDPIGYYLDIIENKYKKCYYSCEKCEMKGNNIEHNCTECNRNYPIEFRVNNYSNCYENCKYYYYFDTNNNYHCTDNDTCPDEYPILDETQCKLLGNKIENAIKNLIDSEEVKKEEIN